MPRYAKGWELNLNLNWSSYDGWSQWSLPLALRTGGGWSELKGSHRFPESRLVQPAPSSASSPWNWRWRPPVAILALPAINDIGPSLLRDSGSRRTRLMYHALYLMRMCKKTVKFRKKPRRCCIRSRQNTRRCHNEWNDAPFSSMTFNFRVVLVGQFLTQVIMARVPWHHCAHMPSWRFRTLLLNDIADIDQSGPNQFPSNLLRCFKCIIVLYF